MLSVCFIITIGPLSTGTLCSWKDVALSSTCFSISAPAPRCPASRGWAGFACQCQRTESSFLAALNTQQSERLLKRENLLMTFQTLTSKEPWALSDSWNWWGWWVMAAILPIPLLGPLEYTVTAHWHADKWQVLFLLLSLVTISAPGHLTVLLLLLLKNLNLFLSAVLAFLAFKIPPSYAFTF